MKKRRLLLGVGLFVALAAAVALYLWSASGSGGINRGSVFRITKGMTEGEVHVIIGMPPGDYRSGLRIGVVIEGFLVVPEYSQYWWGDDGYIAVSFDRRGNVTRRHFTPSSPSIFDRVYQGLGIDAN